MEHRCTVHNLFELKLQVEAEAVILATGYHYTFAFLAPECGVKVENRVVQPLYKHLISIVSPSLAFIGLPVQVLWKYWKHWKLNFSFQSAPFPQFDLQVSAVLQIINLAWWKKIAWLNQVRYFVKTLLGDVKLPSPAEMEADTQVWRDSHIVSVLCFTWDHDDDWRKRFDTEERFWGCRTSTSTRWAHCRWLSWSAWPLWSRRDNPLPRASYFWYSPTPFCLNMTYSISLTLRLFTISHHHNRIGEQKLTSNSPFAPLQWDYNRELARLGGLKPLPDATQNIYMAVSMKTNERKVETKSSQKPLNMLSGPPKKARRSGGLQKGHLDDGKPITCINLPDFLTNVVFHILLNFDTLVLTGLQDADGNFFGNLVKDNGEISARVFESVMMAT